MSDRITLGAQTLPLPVPYPPYVNVSEELDHTVTITVRGPTRSVTTPQGVFPIEGETGVINMSRKDFELLLEEIAAKLHRKPS
ncbi:MAG: hypothetical protein KGL39_48705 [Patescibacteria group bacterium]|nr:hypothetical protein [Patescibacteria group bacterium]